MEACDKIFKSLKGKKMSNQDITFEIYIFLRNEGQIKTLPDEQQQKNYADTCNYIHIIYINIQFKNIGIL